LKKLKRKKIFKVGKMEIIEKKIEKRQVAYISYKGSYDEVPVLMGEVVGFIMAKGLQIMGPPFGVYFNSPQEVPEEELQYEVGMPFAGETDEEGRVKIKTTPEQLVLSTTYKGPYSGAGNAIGALAEYAYKNNYEIIGPPLEIYISDPNETPESELLTEMCFPVMKK
jgi:AraC family transcriptional regulator